MKNYLSFETDIKKLETEIEKLKDPYNQDGLSEVDTKKILETQTEIDKKLKVLGTNAIKVDDSISGILEGKKAKMITVGLTSTGISVGKNRYEFQNLAINEKRKIKNTSRKIFKKIKTDYIVEDHFEFEKLLREKFNIY